MIQVYYYNKKVNQLTKTGSKCGQIENNVQANIKLLLEDSVFDSPLNKDEVLRIYCLKK